METIIFPNGIKVSIRPIAQNTINHNIKKQHNLNDECCMTCKNYISNNCKLQPQTAIFDDFWTICDFYRRKRSGAYRRKRAKYNKERINYGKEKY